MTIVDELRQAHRELKKAVFAKRRAFRREDAGLAASFDLAMEAWDASKGQGQSFEDRCRALEQTLRLAWPKGGTCRCPRCLVRCQECGDTGAIHTKRQADIYRGSLVPVVIPCSCEEGKRYRERPKTSEDFTAAGRTTKPMKRFGR